MALAYVLVLLLAMSGFLAAAMVRYQQTSRFMSFGADSVRARMLADSGAKLAIILMRDVNVAWYQDDYPSPVTSESMGYEPADLGGRFTLEFDSLDGVNESPGTYVSILATGYSGNQTAKTAATVKLSTPITNYVFFSNGNYNIAGWGNPVIRGPVFVNSNGDRGNVTMWHDNRYWDSINHRERHIGATITLDAQIRAVGNISMRNPDYLRSWSEDPMLFDGTIEAGSVSHDDLAGASALGRLNLEGEFITEPNVPVNVSVPEVDDVMESFNARSDVNVVDISDASQGVLAEFIDGELVVSEVAMKDVGHIFDKDLYNQNHTSIENSTLSYYSSSDRAGIEQLIKDEAVFDDPELANLPYPDDLVGDLNGDGVDETEGDAIPVQRITRGAEIARFALTNDNFTSVRLTTSRFDHPGLNPSGEAPPVFVRGIVDGKAALAYDVADEGLVANADKLRMVVLTEHEDPNDTSNDLTTGPGVPGGLRYADKNIPTSPDADVAGATDDQAMLLSRGTLSMGGTTGHNKGIVRDSEGNIINYRQDLNDLVTTYKDHFSSLGYADADWRTGPGGGANVVLHGVFVAGETSSHRNYVTTTGLVESRGHYSPRGTSWGRLPGPDPPGARSDLSALFINNMRGSAFNHGSRIELMGALSSLNRQLVISGGESEYDYRLQQADADVIANEMGLPVSAIVCTWQRL